VKTLESTIDEILDLAEGHFQLQKGALTADDDFFEKLGIDSLKALDLLTQLERHFRIELPDYEMQGASNVRSLAERIHARL
jgi:acyl carrier protein